MVFLFPTHWDLFSLPTQFKDWKPFEGKSKKPSPPNWQLNSIFSPHWLVAESVHHCFSEYSAYVFSILDFLVHPCQPFLSSARKFRYNDLAEFEPWFARSPCGLHMVHCQIKRLSGPYTLSGLFCVNSFNITTGSFTLLSVANIFGAAGLSSEHLRQFVFSFAVCCTL